MARQRNSVVFHADRFEDWAGIHIAQKPPTLADGILRTWKSTHGCIAAW